MGSKMIERQIKALKSLKGKTIEAGWFESSRYPAEEGKEGELVARIARIQEFGANIDHPGGTKYIKDAATKDGFLGTRFVKSDFKGEDGVTKAHQIIIPPRPFMRFAWLNFVKQRSTIQKAIAGKMASGEISPQEGLEQIAMYLENCIAKSIKSGNWEPNAPSTARKKGFNKPLVDTAYMLQSLTSKVN